MTCEIAIAAVLLIDATKSIVLRDAAIERDSTITKAHSATGLDGGLARTPGDSLLSG